MTRYGDMGEDRGFLYVAARIFGVLLLAYVVSGVYSCDEIRYSAFGTKVSGTVDHVAVMRGGRRSQRVLQVDYQFTDNKGTLQRQTAEYPLSAKVNEGDSIEVIYIPDEKYSGVPANRRKTWALLLFGGLNLAMVALIVVVGVKVSRDIREMERKKEADA